MGFQRMYPPIWYVMPMFRQVSFSVIGMKHYEQLKKYFRISIVDELSFPFVQILTNPLILVQPFFYPFQKWEKKLAQKVFKTHALIGVDVADSDQISSYAVHLTNYATALIVPSKKAREAYINSGVKRPVHNLPHGVDKLWIDTPPQPPSLFKHLAELKKKRNYKILLSYIIHSPWRKGLDLLLQYYQLLLNEYNNVLLVIKTAHGVGYFPETLTYKGGVLYHSMEGTVIKKWLSEKEKMELFDLSDLYVLTSRGGGWEHPPMEALARGIPTIGSTGGSWEDYLPDWLLVPSRPSGPVLHNNPIHTGRGVEMLIEKAVDKTLDIFNNEEEYRVKVKEYIDKVIRQTFTWEKIGLKLRDIIKRYL